MSRLAVWNALAVLGWVWAYPLFLISKDRVGLLSRQIVFLKIWIVPGVVAQALIHVDAPGHTLFSITALCLFGAYVLRSGLTRWETQDSGLVIAVVVSAMLFLNFVPLPPPGSPGGLRSSFANATFESSLEYIRWLDDIHGSSLREIRGFTTPDRKVVIIGQDALEQSNWYLNWRIARYYLPDADIRSAATEKHPAETKAVRGMTVEPARIGSPVDIPVGDHSRILWLVENGGSLYAALAKAGAIHGGPHVFYTDVDESNLPFQVLGFRIVKANGI